MVGLRIYQALTYLIWPLWALWILSLYVFHPVKKLKYQGQLWDRLGLNWKMRSTPEGINCWWFHSVSLGETQAVLALVERVVKEHPQDRVIFSHMTTTAIELAKKHLGNKVEHLILGPDLPLLAYVRVRAARPHKLIFVESDVWPSLAYYAKSQGASVYVVNGRLSDRSSQKFEKFSCFSRQLWNLVDTCIVQSSFQKELWQQAQMPIEKIQVGGFLKLDRPAPKLDAETLKNLEQRWPAKKGDMPTYYITLSCTHEPEERLLLEKLLSYAQSHVVRFRILLGPRHMPRQVSIMETVKALGLPLVCLSDQAAFEQESGPISVLLIDRMGFLSYCYEISSLCLVAGSWISHVGGHNILEPVLQDVPTLCGPYVYKQQDVWQLASQFDLVRKAPLDDFESNVEAFLSKGSALEEWKKRSLNFKKECEGALERCYKIINQP